MPSGPATIVYTQLIKRAGLYAVRVLIRHTQPKQTTVRLPDFLPNFVVTFACTRKRVSSSDPV